MGKLLLKGKYLRKLGYTEDKVISRAIQVMHGYYKHTSKSEALELIPGPIDSLRLCLV